MYQISDRRIIVKKETGTWCEM